MKVIIGNSLCKIVGFSLKEFNQLRSILSYSESQRTRFGWGSVRKYLLSKRGDFPTGLLYLVIKWGLETKTKIDFRDTRVPPKTRFKELSAKLPFTPYKEQEDAAKAILGANGRGIVVAPTGSGKSVMIALIISTLKVKTLVVVPSLELKTQLTSDFAKFFGADKVGPSGKKGAMPYLITIENVDALDYKYKPQGIDLVIIDEFHHSAANTYRKLNEKSWVDVYHRVGMTATPFRNKTEERLLLESLLDKVVYQITFREAVSKGFIVPIQAFYYELPKIKPKGNQKSYQAMYNELVVNNEYRNALIANLLATLDKEKVSTLVLLKEIKHGENIQKLVADRNIAFANGNNSDNRILLLEFNLRERISLIATGVLGEGADTKPCEYVILAGGGKSKPQLIQNIGRGLRRHGDKHLATIILFKDPSHKWMLDHFKECVKHIREEYGFEPIKVDING